MLIEEYAVASDSTLGEVTQTINDAIADGYQPFGGIHFLIVDIGGVQASQYSQAMVKYAKEKPDEDESRQGKTVTA